MELPPTRLIQESMNDAPNNEWVYGQMNYVTPATTLISTRRDLAGSDGVLEGAEFVPTSVNIHNARHLDKNLHQHGFQLLPSPVSSLNIDFYSHNDVVERYYPHCEALVDSFLLTESNGNDDDNRVNMQVTAFDHNVRSNQGAGKTLLKGGSGTATVQNPAGLVHADYTKVSAPRRLEQLGQAQKANDVLKQVKNDDSSTSTLDATVVQEALEGKRRFAFINVWRNIADEPVQQFPLACIDATTMNTRDLRTFQIHYADRVGENYFCCPSPNHQWCYYPNMERNEAILLKQWDSHGDVANDKDVDRVLSTMTVHSAFCDPTSLATAPPRQSIEVRCVVIWDKE